MCIIISIEISLVRTANPEILLPPGSIQISTWPSQSLWNACRRLWHHSNVPSRLSIHNYHYCTHSWLVQQLQIIIVTALIFCNSICMPIFQVTRAILENPKDNTKVYLIYANVTHEDILLKVILTLKFPSSQHLTT